MSNIIDIERIFKLIPHRYPLLLVDKVIDFKPNEEAVGIKNVTFNEPHFMGHFPSKPIMPGVLIVEALAQTAAILVVSSNEENLNKLVYFMSIDNTKFRKPVIPGDVLELYVKAIQNRGAVWRFEGYGIVNGQKVAESQFSAMMVDKK